MKKIMWIIALAAVSLYVAAGIVYMYQKGATIRIMVIFAIFILIGNILIIVSECKKIKSMELAAGIVYFMAVMILILKNDESMVDISDLVVYAMSVLASTCSASYLFVKGKIKKR